MKFFQKIAAFCLWSLIFCFIISCSQKKNTFTSRTFHNLTARYNGLYWANVNLGEAIQNIEKAHKDDYNKLLPVFKYGDEKIAKANYPQLDKAIEKNNKMIQYHSMLIKGHEYCRWIDENYMTMGMAHFYKRDYYAALLVFDYVVKMFSEIPTKYDAFLWIVRTNNQMSSVIKTGPILDVLKHDAKLPKRLKDDYFSVLSDYYIRTDEFKKAIDALNKTIPLTKKKNVRARYIYILAQLYEQEGNFKKASMYYNMCAKLHPSYDMEFNARLSKARTFQVDGGEDTKDLKRELTKMLRDEKNKDYRDQIYYALGDLSARENDIPTAIKLFKSSAQSSVTNVQQKAVSYLRIADIYFDQRSYKLAGSYYDSTMTFLAKDYKNYDQIKNKKESLSSLIKNITIIDREDSLLKIASMDTAQISKVVAGIIAKVIDDEKKKKEELELKKNQQSASPADNSALLNTNTGSWYFYNPATMASGFKDFFKKWGNRTLEDNWRRSNKQQVMAEQQQQGDAVDTSRMDTSSGAKKIPLNQTADYYKKNIPFTNEQKAKSNEKILEAYYNLGGIYKEDLDDDEKAEETFENLLKHYPNSKYTLNLYYQLYRLYLTDNNKGKAAFYKGKIIDEFPTSEYAKLINNPNYQKSLLASQNEIEKFYAATYSAYNEGRYDNVLAMTGKADSFYSGSELMPKFALLRAFSIGKTRGMDDYENALEGIIAKYPKDPAKAKAQELLDYIKQKRKAPVDTVALKDTLKYKSPYTFKDSVEHECMIIVSAKKVNVNDFLAKISNFNGEYFRLSNLTANNMMMDLDHQLFIIKSFPVASKAKDYYDLINQDSIVFKGISPEDYQIFPISTDNFTVFYREKKVEEYRDFFLENYFRKKED